VGALLAELSFVERSVAERADLRGKAAMKAQIKKHRERLEGRVLVPALLWMAGVPFGIVVLLWFFFFRGH
jgi:hypothetical protein